VKKRSSAKRKMNASLIIGIVLVAGVGMMFAARFLGVPFPFIYSNSRPAPEGVAVTITLLAFCRDNSTEVLAVKEFKPSEFTWLTASGKEIMYFAVTATFLAGPPKDEILDTVDLTYELRLKTSSGALEPVQRTVRIPVVANLALHQSPVVQLTPEELGLNSVGDATLLTAEVSVTADMYTDRSKATFTSSGVAEARLSCQEGGFMRNEGTWGQVSEKGAGTVVAALTGTWQKPKWKVVSIVTVVDPKTGLKAYILAEPGENSVDVTGAEPDYGDNPTTTVEPGPIDVVHRYPTPQPTSPGTVNIPFVTNEPRTTDIGNPPPPPPYSSPLSDSLGEPVVTISGSSITVTNEPREEDRCDVGGVDAPAEPEHYSGDPYSYGWLSDIGLMLRGFFNPYRTLWPIYIFGKMVDLTFILVAAGAVMVTVIGVAIALSRKKR